MFKSKLKNHWEDDDDDYDEYCDDDGLTIGEACLAILSGILGGLGDI